MKTRFTEEQMVSILREADQRPVPEIAKKHGISAQTISGYASTICWRYDAVLASVRRRALSSPQSGQHPGADVM